MNPASEKDPQEISEEELLLKNDFGKYFHRYGIDYKVESPWLVVGELNLDGKWVLFLSVLQHDVKPLLETVLPILFLHKIPFKVLQNYEYVKRMNAMWLGLYEVGKIVTVCPPDAKSAVRIAKELASLTESFKGPIVQDALRLGSILFANICEVEVNEDNEATGLLVNYVPQKSKIPFKINRLYRVKKRKGIVGRYYVPLKVLRPNAKGDVSWGVNMKKWAFSPCVIKQGRAFSFYDSYGRDPIHKLIWQKYVLEDIQDKIPVPRLIDFCKKKDDYYLIMEFIEGNTLSEEIKKRYADKSWKDFSKEVKTEILMFYRDVLAIIANLHELGYVHRDITGTNFIIDKSGKMYLLDFELTSSVKKGIPDPPHGLGTMGYVSPEQMKSSTPTFMEDIYSLGALLMTLVTGKHPQEIMFDGPEEGERNLSVIIGEGAINTLIFQSMDTDPNNRPALNYIIAVIDAEIGEIGTKKESDNNKSELLQEASLIR
jgi:Protein kinase domain